jgi:SAM-dependent methyltransferase
MASGPGVDERQAFDPTSPWWGEHLARYRFAAARARGGRALDIACGTGYGLAIVGGATRLVIGADRDPEALAQARRAAPAGGAVLATDAASLPFRTAAFDLVTSFETVEHLPERPAFLAELARVLAPEGLCVLSTPNARYTQPVNGKPRNPFHLYEYEPDEIRAELQKHFTQVTILGQHLDRDRFLISPFWDDQQRMPRSLATVGQLAMRRVLGRLPVALRDPVSRAVWGHTYYPQPDDYRFSPERLTDAPVIVALCRKQPETSPS